MSPEQVAIIISEVDRRFRSRTPARSVVDGLPDDRVNRSEIWAFAKEHGIELSVFVRDDDFDRAIFALFDRLRVEFPQEKWAPRSHWTAATKARRKELGMR